MTRTSALLTPGEMARRCGVSPETIRRWARQGRIDYVRSPSGRIRFPEDQKVLQEVPRQESA